MRWDEQAHGSIQAKRGRAPQQVELLSFLVAHVCMLPAVSQTTSDSPAGTVDWPAELSPARHPAVAPAVPSTRQPAGSCPTLLSCAEAGRTQPAPRARVKGRRTPADHARVALPSAGVLAAGRHLDDARQPGGHGCLARRVVACRGQRQQRSAQLSNDGGGSKRAHTRGSHASHRSTRLAGITRPSRPPWRRSSLHTCAGCRPPPGWPAPARPGRSAGRSCSLPSKQLADSRGEAAAVAAEGWEGTPAQRRVHRCWKTRLRPGRRWPGQQGRWLRPRSWSPARRPGGKARDCVLNSAARQLLGWGTPRLAANNCPSRRVQAAAPLAVSKQCPPAWCMSTAPHRNKRRAHPALHTAPALHDAGVLPARRNVDRHVGSGEVVEAAGHFALEILVVPCSHGQAGAVQRCRQQRGSGGGGGGSWSGGGVAHAAAAGRQAAGRRACARRAQPGSSGGQCEARGCWRTRATHPSTRQSRRGGEHRRGTGRPPPGRRRPPARTRWGRWSVRNC